MEPAGLGPDDLMADSPLLPYIKPQWSRPG